MPGFVLPRWKNIRLQVHSSPSPQPRREDSNSKCPAPPLEPAVSAGQPGWWKTHHLSMIDHSAQLDNKYILCTLLIIWYVKFEWTGTHRLILDSKSASWCYQILCNQLIWRYMYKNKPTQDFIRKINRYLVFVKKKKKKKKGNTYNDKIIFSVLK